MQSCRRSSSSRRPASRPPSGRRELPVRLRTLRRQMRTSVERDDARLVDHLDQNHHVSRRLHDLIVVVVGAGSMGGPARSMTMQRTLERLILHGVGRATHALSRLGTRPRSASVPPLSSEEVCPFGGSTISDVRRFSASAALVAVQSELREVVVDVGDRARLGLLAFDDGRPLELSRALPHACRTPW